MNKVLTTSPTIIPQRPALATANSDADEALRRVQGRPAPTRPPASVSRPLPTEPAARRRAIRVRGW